jgi:hypothetical protein
MFLRYDDDDDDDDEDDDDDDDEPSALLKRNKYFQHLNNYKLLKGAHGSVVGLALCYQPGGCGFDSR